MKVKPRSGSTKRRADHQRAAAFRSKSIEHFGKPRHSMLSVDDDPLGHSNTQMLLAMQKNRSGGR